MNIVINEFGFDSHGNRINEICLKNKNDMQLNVINYGAIINKIIVPDKNKKFENVVMGLNNIEEYEKKSQYFGSIIGRVAGRISNAKIKIDEIEYNLEKNEGENTLHGGTEGLDKKFYEFETFMKKDKAGIILKTKSKDGECGFPGNLDIEIIYSLNDENEIELMYKVKSDKKTYVNLTNHTYFNLSGNLKENILNHYIKINSEKVIYLDENTLPKKVVNTNNTEFDFKQYKKIGKNINSKNEQLIRCNGYDHPYILKDIEYCAKVKDEKSGRELQIITDQPCVVFYSGNQIKDNIHMAFCLETQYYPDALNSDFLDKKLLNKDEFYTSYTKWIFKMIED
ncbi:galactose mutarotase [Oceanotoga sp. DSM 15011]|uniref:Aldose 1-epimerase n=1 Tax=Oceanotoga teriensis TaxID=515440 RepID=A0AA45C5M2_9BACT|nr:MULTISPECIES: aldose epimerase family protein [Oceanotoga]MDO7976414.1 galactose mutarotase [Oceanotoga teriensis]PWJ89046.1 aldose 1-epimerase [Oceanotoga teriensis]UYP01410.1 galactose mutarotase [Oceanotoga sp. DSM 15011]